MKTNPEWDCEVCGRLTDLKVGNAWCCERWRCFWTTIKRALWSPS